MPYDQSNHRRHKKSRTAAEREAEHILTQSLAAARTETEAPSTPFATLKGRVAARSPAGGPAGARLPLRFLAAITLHRRLSIGLVSAGLVAVFITLVPFSYERTVGYEVIAAWAAQEGAAEQTEAVADAVESQVFASVDGQVAANDSARVVVHKPVTTTKTDDEGTRVIVRPIVKKESGSLYSRVRTDLLVQSPEDGPRPPKEVFESLLDGLDLENMSDAELKEEIGARLEARGLSHYRVSLNRDLTDEDGKRRMIVGVSTDGDDLQPEVIMTTGLMDTLLDGLDLQDPDVSDAQLRAMIEERLARAGKRGARVEIFTDWDGERQAEIKLERVDEDD